MSFNDINNRQDNSLKVERTRLLSDNYNAHLISGYGTKNEISFNLSDYGLKSIKWDARDEVVYKKPCTRLEEIAMVYLKGFDFDLTFGKNSSDLMKIFLDQHIAYMGGMNIKQNDLSIDTKNSSSKLNIQKRTETKKLGNVESKTSILSNVSTNFETTSNYTSADYLTPRFDLKINVQHYNTKVESLLFRNCVFFKPSQSTSENSAEIDESIKMFASSVEQIGNQVNSPKAEAFIHNALSLMLQKNVNENDLHSHDRKIINSDNLKIYKDNGKFTF